MSTSIHVLCDAAYAQAADGERGPSHPRLVIATTILASSLAFIDGSVDNVGLPAIGASFQADAAGLQWVINAYLLPLSALLLLGGAAGDRFGRVRLLVGAPRCSGSLPLAARSPRACPGCLSRAEFRESARQCSCPIAWRSWGRRFPAKLVDGQSVSGRPWPP